MSFTTLLTGERSKWRARSPELGGSATITTNVAEEIRLRRFERVG